MVRVRQVMVPYGMSGSLSPGFGLWLGELSDRTGSPGIVGKPGVGLGLGY